MVLAIIAASVALVMFILSVFGAIIGVPGYRYHGPSYRVSVYAHNRSRTASPLCRYSVFTNFRIFQELDLIHSFHLFN